MSDKKFLCPHCTQSLEADSEMVGVEVPCPTCGKNITVPAQASLPPPPATRPNEPDNGTQSPGGDGTPEIISVVKWVFATGCAILPSYWIAQGVFDAFDFEAPPQNAVITTIGFFVGMAALILLRRFLRMGLVPVILMTNTAFMCSWMVMALISDYHPSYMSGNTRGCTYAALVCLGIGLLPLIVGVVLRSIAPRFAQDAKQRHRSINAPLV